MSLQRMHEQSRQRSSSDKELIDQQIRRISELEMQVQQTLSEKQELVSIVQQQKKKIADQAEQIEKLNGSDLVLKENDALKKLNEQLKREKQDAEKEADEVTAHIKAEYERKSEALEKNRREAENKLLFAKAVEEYQEGFIGKKAKELYASQEKVLESVYKAKELALHGAFLTVLLYGVLSTVFAACRSKTFISDFKAFFVTTWGLVSKLWETALNGANTASQWGNIIPNEVLSMIISGVLMAIVFLLIFGGVLSCIGFFGYKLLRLYITKYADNISLAVVLVSLAVAVYFADFIRNAVPVNMLVLLLIVQCVYIGIRIAISHSERL